MGDKGNSEMDPRLEDARSIWGERQVFQTDTDEQVNVHMKA